MDLRQLAALTAVADHGTFSAAADALHTVQSNVSAHVARLERELDAVLVDRAAGQLTPEGEAVVARARRVASELEALAADVAAVRHDVSGPVRLGMIGTTGRWLAPPLLAACAADHPGVRLAISEGTTTSLVPRLADGDLDAAILNLPVLDRDIAARPLFDEDLVLVVAVDDPLAGAGEIDLATLAEQPLLLPITGTAFRDELDGAAAAAGVSLVPKAELDGVRLIASLTFEGHGPAVLPASALPAIVKDRFCSIAVAGLPRRRVGVAVRRRAQPSAPVRAVLTLLDGLAATSLRPPGLHPPRSA